LDAVPRKNHEIEFYNGPQGIDSYLSRFSLPANGTSFAGHWYSFRVGAVFFISLDGNDVAYQDSGPAVSGPNPLTPVPATGNAPITPGASFYIRGYSGGEQTRWLEATLRKASEEEGIDWLNGEFQPGDNTIATTWIVVQTHYGALSSTKTGNGSDKGAREQWLPLFDKYGVDLVLCGHDHDYERSYPVRGANPNAGTDAATGAVVETLQPRPAIPADPAATRFDTTQGTVHLILGGGGTSAPLDVYGEDTADGKVQAKVFTKRNESVAGTTPGTFIRNPADAVEDAIWSAQRDTSTGYGIGVFDYEPCRSDGKTTITFRYYHAVGADKTPTGDYELFETIVFEKERGK
jgi:3',5'-cyclic AMP phosphodiesterase CpdA